MDALVEYAAYPIPTRSIYAPLDFNCRQPFTLASVEALANKIAATRLEIPVIVQPISDVPDAPPGFDYRLIAGYRRFTAVTTYLKWDTIPAVIRYGLSQRDAELLNLTENLERQDLNPLEEAIALQRLFPDGCSLRTAAKEIKRDTHWVHQRLRLLELSEALQLKVAARMLTLLDVDMLIKLPDDERDKAAEELIAARGKNKRKLIVNPAFRRKFRQPRRKKEVNERISQLMQLGLDGLATRFGAWFAGYRSDEEFDADIKLALSGGL